MNTPSTVTAYLANLCVRTNLQVRLMWCLVGTKRQEYGATIETKARTQQLELMERTFLELCIKKMPRRTPAKELNDLDSYRELEEVKRCSNKELKITRELLERVRSLNKYALLGKQAEVLPICVRCA